MVHVSEELESWIGSVSMVNWRPTVWNLVQGFPEDLQNLDPPPQFSIGPTCWKCCCRGLPFFLKSPTLVGGAGSDGTHHLGAHQLEALAMVLAWTLAIGLVIWRMERWRNRWYQRDTNGWSISTERQRFKVWILEGVALFYLDCFIGLKVHAKAGAPFVCMYLII